MIKKAFGKIRDFLVYIMRIVRIFFKRTLWKRARRTFRNKRRFTIQGMWVSAGIVGLFLWLSNLNIESKMGTLKELPFAKIAIGAGIFLAVGLLIWLGWSKRAGLGKAARGIGTGIGREIGSKLLTAIVVLALLNLAFWAGMNQFQKEWGNSYFLETWLWSPAFWLLTAVTIALGLSGDGKEKKFGAFRAAIAGIALLTTVVAIFPGFWGPEKPSSSASSTGSAVVGTTFIGMPAKLAFDPADSIPAESAELIEEVFGDLPDSTVQEMKRIAYAESRGNHWKAGSANQVLQGNINPRDLGLFQVNDSLHGKTCQEAGLDLMEPEGNARCARLLYDRKKGTQDWYLSAWSWRDRYSERPENWSFNRTPQVLTQSVSGREVIFVDAPVTEESERVYTHNRKYCYDVVGDNTDTPYLIQDDVGTVDTIIPGRYITHKRYARWYTFRSLGENGVKIIFVKSPPGVLECNVAM